MVLVDCIFRWIISLREIPLRLFTQLCNFHAEQLPLVDYLRCSVEAYIISYFWSTGSFAYLNTQNYPIRTLWIMRLHLHIGSYICDNWTDILIFWLCFYWFSKQWILHFIVEESGGPCSLHSSLSDVSTHLYVHLIELRIIGRNHSWEDFMPNYQWVLDISMVHNKQQSDQNHV